jgi:hypothetical protein
MEKKMTAKRIAVKFYAQNPDVVDTHAFVAVFQRWIQEHTVEGLLIDVADYKHVPNGPGVLLIAHEGDYSYHLGEGRAGVQYISKHPLSDTLETAVATVLRLTLEAAVALEKEASLNGLVFDFSTVRIVLQDRLNFPNNEAMFAAVQPVIKAFFEQLLGVGVEIANGNPADSREALTLLAGLPEGISGVALLDKLKVAE